MKLINQICTSLFFVTLITEVAFSEDKTPTVLASSTNSSTTASRTHSGQTKNFDYTHTFYREKKVKDAQGKDTAQLEYVEQTLPGEELVAIATFKYKEKKPASEVVFTLPLPKETIYVEGSATNEKSVWFSTDSGKTWAAFKNLRVIESDGTKRIATGKDVTHLQWRMANDMQPGHEGKLEYKVIIR